MKISIKYAFVFLLIAFTPLSRAQTTMTLDELLEHVIASASVSKIAQTSLRESNHAYDFYKTLLKPSLSLNVDLPNYSKTSSPIVQPDGRIAFQSIRQANSSINLFATQVVPATGATLFASSDLQRFDDYSSDFTQYNGIPIRLGINQPIFGFNPWKYRKKLESHRLEEAQRQFNLDIETGLSTGVSLYFDILIEKQNLEIAKTNEKVNENLLNITEERLRLGKVSEDEKLQLEIELNTAKLEVSQARTRLDRAISDLYTFLSMDVPEAEVDYLEPAPLNNIQLDVDALLAAYQKNRPEISAYFREIVELDRDRAEAKANYGIRADLQASVGLARGSDKLGDIYRDPFDEQQFSLSVTVPILDWGRRKHAVRQIEIQKESRELQYEQEVLQLENALVQNSQSFSRLQQELTFLKEIMSKAEQRFDISNERYMLGDIDITNLTLAQREKDQAKRNYINALRSYWMNYYELRRLSGYDIRTNEHIQYTN